MPPQTQTRKIIIKVDTSEARGLKQVTDQVSALNKSTKSLQGNMGFLTNAFRAWVGYIGVREITQISDEMQNLGNRLKIVTGSTEEATQSFEGLVSMADRTYQSISGVGEVYTRMAQALKGVGASSKEVLALTETLINSFRVAGTTTTETVNTVRQLSQAFSSGRLSGDELRSVMEQNVIVASALRERFGGDLYKKAKEGAIGLKDVLIVLRDNQQKIFDSASKLAPTFEQTLTRAMNKITVAIGYLNEKYQLSAKFAVLMGFVTDNLTSIMITMGGAVTALALSQIPALLSAFTKIKVALATIHPLLLAFVGLATLGGVVYENWNKVTRVFDQLSIKLKEFSISVDSTFLSMSGRMDEFFGTSTKPEFVKATVNRMQAARKEIEELKKGLDAPKEAVKDPVKAAMDSLDSLIKKIKDTKGEGEKFSNMLKILNGQFLSKKITIEEYAVALNNLELRKLSTELRDGKKNVAEYAKVLSELRIKELNLLFSESKISLDQFNQGVAAASLESLNKQLALGVIGLREYNSELTKLEDKFRAGSSFYTGVSDFIESAGTISQGVARVTTQAFDHLSDTLTDVFTKGKADFAAFAKAVLDDITAMIVRAALVRPIAQGILGFFDAPSFSGGSGLASLSGGAGMVPTSEFARGGIMSSQGPVPLNRYASGGIADSPQMALFGEGRRPEAYVPLPDGKSIPVSMEGSGGISVVQNIVVNSDGSFSSTDKTQGQRAKELSDMMRRVAIDTIIQQQRSGGVLA